MVATVLPLRVVRSWTSRVRRPLPVRVSIRGTLGSGWSVGCRSPGLPAGGPGGENARGRAVGDAAAPARPGHPNRAGLCADVSSETEDEPERGVDVAQLGGREAP